MNIVTDKIYISCYQVVLIKGFSTQKEVKIKGKSGPVVFNFNVVIVIYLFFFVQFLKIISMHFLNYIMLTFSPFSQDNTIC